jgi:hypothetical protein
MSKRKESSEEVTGGLSGDALLADVAVAPSQIKWQQ